MVITTVQCSMLCTQLNNKARVEVTDFLQHMASLTKWWLLEAYFATHSHSAQHNNYKIMRARTCPLNSCPREYVPTEYVPTQSSPQEFFKASGT